MSAAGLVACPGRFRFEAANHLDMGWIDGARGWRQNIHVCMRTVHQHNTLCEGSVMKIRELARWPFKLCRWRHNSHGPPVYVRAYVYVPTRRYASEMVGHCGIGSWARNSRIVRRIETYSYLPTSRGVACACACVRAQWMRNPNVVD